MAILMCRPAFYGVEYEINPWMRIQNAVDHREAEAEWQALFDAYSGLGQKIELAEPVKGHPDMVFTANAALIHRRRAILARFRHPERAGEEPHWRKELERLGFEILTLPEGVAFEGAGDALFVGERLFAGYGFRTDHEAHDLIAERLGIEVVSLRLADPRFYHLDTCFCPLGPDTVMFAPDAFSPESAQTILREVPHVIEVPADVATAFVCNAAPVRGRLVSPVGVERLNGSIRKAGFDPLALPMSEFIKSGGAVRCLSLFLD